MADDTSVEATCNRDWAELPKDILDAIISHLYGEDMGSFHLVCRSWNAAEECVFQKEHNPLLYPVPQSQWLLHKQCSELNYQFIHPVYPDVRYAKNLLEEAEKGNDEATVRHSKDGWLLMSKEKYSLFFFSPFPNKLVIKLPDLPKKCHFDGAAFSCAPTSSTDCCVIFGISCLVRTHVDISTIRLGKKKWKCNQYENNILFRPSFSNPVFYKEMFYCLSLEGNLGTYDHTKDTWTVLGKPLSPRKWAYENYLVEHEGGLMSLFMGNSGSWVSIFKLNECDMVWENIYSLGDYALFVSLPTTFATKSVLGMMKNKIFFSWLHNNYIVFYCPETKTFRTYGSDLNGKNLYRSEIAKQFESSWIEPRGICLQEEEVDWLLLETNVEDTHEYETDDESEYETDDDGYDYETNDELISYEEEAEEDEIYNNNNNEEYEAIHESQEETEDDWRDIELVEKC